MLGYDCALLVIRDQVNESLYFSHDTDGMTIRSRDQALGASGRCNTQSLHARVTFVTNFVFYFNGVVQT